MFAIYRKYFVCLQETTVWCVAITDDFVIISGDSRGTTSFWDGKVGTLLEEVNAHKAAVLCLCLSEDQQTVYSAGQDLFVSFYDLFIVL